MMEIHISRSAWFGVAPQTINGLKKSILTILDSNYVWGYFVAGGDDSGQQKQGANREIDAIFPILRTFHP